MSERPRIKRVELRCSDPEKSAEFYCRLVGLEMIGLTGNGATLAARGSREPLMMLRRAEQPGRAPRAATGLFHTAFLYRDRAELGRALVRAVDEMGLALTGASDHGVSEALYVDDPDGLGIELYWDRPRERWPEPGAGDRVAMFTRPLDLGSIAAAASDAPGGGGAVGHVHLKVASTEAAERFWTEVVGMEVMTRFGAEASFLAFDDYHHHIGANSWFSRAMAPEPAEGPGLDAVAVIAGEERELTTPDGVAVLCEPPA